MKTIRCIVEYEQPALLGSQWHSQRRKVEIVSDQTIRIPATSKEYNFVGSDGEYAVFKRPNPNGLRVKICLAQLDGLRQTSVESTK